MDWSRGHSMSLKTINIAIGQAENTPPAVDMSCCLPRRTGTVSRKNHTQWLERIMLMKPDRVVIVRGANPEPKVENILTSALREKQIPVVWQIANHELTALPHRNIRFMNNVVEVRIMLPSIESWSFEQERAMESLDGLRTPGTAFHGFGLIIPLTGENTPQVDHLIQRLGPTENQAAKIQFLEMHGLWHAPPETTLPLPELQRMRELAQPWFESCRLHHIDITFHNIPRCAIPQDLLPYCSTPVSPQSAVQHACSLCVLHEICHNPHRDRGLTMARGEVRPFKSFRDVTKHIRRELAHAWNAEQLQSTALLSVGGDCNNDCEDCPEESRGRPALSTIDAVQQITRAFASGKREILFTNGEATIRKDFTKLLKTAVWLGMKIRLDTNGRALRDAVLLEPLRRASAIVRIRLAGADAASHNSRTGARSFDETVQGIQNAVAAGLHTEITVRLRPELFTDPTALTRLATEFKGVRRLTLEATNDWVGYAGATRFSELFDLLESMVRDAASHDDFIPVRIEGIPICLFNQFPNLYRPGESSRHMKPAVCAPCAWKACCCGLPEAYTLKFGSSELKPNLTCADSCLEFKAANDTPDIDPEQCPILAGERQTPAPEAHAFIKREERYMPHKFTRAPLPATQTVTGKNLLLMAWDMSGGMARQCIPAAACANCVRRHDCAMCFDTLNGGAPAPASLLPPDSNAVVITRNGEATPLFEGAVKILSYGDFRARWAHEPVQMSETDIVVFHDVADLFPSVDQAYASLRDMSGAGTEIWITGRNQIVTFVTKNHNQNAVPATPPAGFSRAAPAHGFKLVGYVLSTAGNPDFWLLRFIRTASPLPTALREKLASLFIIKTCVANCLMCNVQNYFKNTRMPAARVARMLQELSIAGFDYVDLFGGEVTLRDDLHFLVDCARSAGLLPMVITTGHNMNRALAARLRNAGVVRCTVSLDAPDRFLHEKIKGARGLFEKACEAVEALSRTPGIEVHVNTVLMPENVQYAPDIIPVAGRRGASLVRFFLCVNSPATSPVPRVLDKEQLRTLLNDLLPRIMDQARAWNMEIDFRPELPGSPEDFPAWIEHVAEGNYNPVHTARCNVCKAPDVRTLIDLEGNVYPCEIPLLFASPHVLGNIENGTLLDILHSAEMKSFRKNAGHFEECRMCFGAMPGSV